MYLEKDLCPNTKCGLCSFQASKFVFFPESTERLERDSESTIIKFPLSSIVSVNFVLTNLWCRGE